MKALRVAWLAIVTTFGLAVAAQPTPPAPTEWERLYQGAVLAQNNGTYADYLLNLSGDAGLRERLLRQVSAHLEEIAALPAAERKASLEGILSYYSKKLGGYKDSALRLPERTGISARALSTGKFSATELAADLMDGVADYVQETEAPLLQEVEAEVLRDFPDRNILCLGRDFTAGFVYMRLRQNLKSRRVQTLNVSRSIRDLVNAGQTQEIRDLLAANGLDEAKLKKRGLVFLDSSMAGKIPKAIVKAVIEKMDARSARAFLAKTDIRYVKAKQSVGTPYRQVVDSLVQSKASVAQIGAAIDQALLVTTFQIPGIRARAEFNQSKLHHLLEHRFKYVLSTEAFTQDPASGLRIDSRAPQTLIEKVGSLLGLAADLELVAASGGKLGARMDFDARHALAKAKPVGMEDMDWRALTMDAFAQIDQAAAGGFKPLKAYQSAEIPGATQFFGTLLLQRTADGEFPYTLSSAGKTLYQLSEPVGEGRNVVVYRTSFGTALKIVKSPGLSAKQILQAWSADLMEQYGIRPARTIGLHPTGVLLEQEFIEGQSLELRYAFKPNPAMPPSVVKQVLEARANMDRILKERGIWLDFKAANVQLDGRKIVFVDPTPRLNNGHWRYYYRAKRDGTRSSRRLTEQQFLEEFLLRQVRDGKTFATPERPPCAQTLLGNG